MIFRVLFLSGLFDLVDVRLDVVEGFYHDASWLAFLICLENHVIISMRTVHDSDDGIFTEAWVWH